MNTKPAQRYSPALIEEFLSVLREIGSVSAAAKQLGLNRSTCSNWAIEAGMASTCLRRPSAKQIQYLRLRQEGMGRRVAALAVGASNRAPMYGTNSRLQKTRSRPKVMPGICRINRK